MTQRASVSKTNLFERQIASNLSQTIDVNTVSALPPKQINSIIPEQNSAIGSTLHMKRPSEIVATWDIKKCVTCNCWTHAYNPVINKFAVVLNNRVSSKRLNSLGLL